MLSFAAKVNDQKPADTYKNTITMSVVSSPQIAKTKNLVSVWDLTGDQHILAIDNNYYLDTLNSGALNITS